jgi:DNA-binding IclR family transcriptional regulator
MHNTIAYAQDPEKSILTLLQKEEPRDLSIQEIADKTGIHRNTVSKYVFGLEKGGKIKSSRTVGRAKMYTTVQEGENK